jgi:hypothetical protein
MAAGRNLAATMAEEQFRIVRAERSQVRLRIALQAPSGGGKTATSLILARGMVQALRARGKLPTHLDGVYIGVLDTERDSASLYSHLVPFDTLVLEPPYSPVRYSAALRALERVGYPIIIADQITHEWHGKGGVLDQVSNSREQNEFARWNGPSQDHEQFIDDLLQSPAHLIATMRSKTEWVLEDKVGRDGRTRKTPTRIGMAAKQRAGTEFEFTTVFDLAVPSNDATSLKDRTELFPVGERFGRLDDSVGVRMIDWVYGATRVVADAGVPPALQARAMLEAAVRLMERAETVPDLVTLFTEQQRLLRGMSVTAGRDVVVPLLEQLVAAKDKRKEAFGPEVRVAPTEELISPHDVVNLELMLSDAKVEAGQFKDHLGVARLALLPLARLGEAQGWLIHMAAERGVTLERIAHTPVRPEPKADPTGREILAGITAEIAAKRDAESGSRSFFEGMPDDIPPGFDEPAAATRR